jgi:AcrR family transcriptional regulator
VSQSTTAQDGRATRWEQHRRERRVELVEATMRAVRRHGAGVGMDEIAAEAGTSKTVLYRHFGDKAGLYLAVAESVDRRIARDLDAALGTSTHAVGQAPHGVEAAVDAYLALVERDPEVYRFVVSHPLLDRPALDPHDDPVAGITNRIGDRLAGLVTGALTAAGRDASSAGALAHGVVGLVRAAADHWLTTPDPLPRTELAHQLGTLIDGGLRAVLDPTEDR